jgi:hypothetical protein
MAARIGLRPAYKAVMVMRFLAMLGALVVLAVFSALLLYISPVSIVVVLAVSTSLVATLVLAYWISPESLESETPTPAAPVTGSLPNMNAPLEQSRS